MWRAFHTAAFASVGETLRATRPIPVRWLLMRSTTLEARSARGVPQSEPGVQSPTTAPAGAAATPAAAAIDRRSSAALMAARRENVPDIGKDPSDRSRLSDEAEQGNAGRPGSLPPAVVETRGLTLGSHRPQIPRLDQVAERCPLLGNLRELARRQAAALSAAFGPDTRPHRRPTRRRDSSQRVNPTSQRLPLLFFNRTARLRSAALVPAPIAQIGSG